MLAQTSEYMNKYAVMMWKKSKDQSSFEKPITLIESCDSDMNLVSYGCSKMCVAAGVKTELAIHCMKSGKTKYVKDADKFNKNKSVTCVACHPTDSCVAAGLESGRILLWYNFFDNSVPTSSLLHWHALSVSCLSFTPNGSCLLSGGHECVMVRWQVGNQNNRDFKPRMGAPLHRIQVSPDGATYAVTTSDNVIQLLDINLKVLLVYRGLTRCKFNSKFTEYNPIPCGLTYDPRSRTLVTNGLPGHLQFYSLALNKQLYNLDIVGQNYISPENLDRPTVVTEVTKAAISHDGRWIATFETWDDGFFAPDMRLKFWSYSTEAQTYTLNTRVEYPHDRQVTSMMFRPPSPNQSLSESCPTLVTLGNDSCFKLWMLVDDTDIYRENVRWNCDSVGFYRGLKGLAADFSTDGSILAVGFEHLLTLWDPDNNVVRSSLSNSLPHREDIRHVKFGDYSCKHQVVVMTSHHIIVWDLLSLSILWSIKEQSSFLIRDPASDLMAMISVDKLSVFRPSSSAMLFSQDKVSTCPVLDAVFVPGIRSEALSNEGWPGTSQIFLYNTEQQLITLDRPADMKQNDAANKVRIAQNLPQSALSSFLSQSRSRDTQVSQHGADTMGRTKPVQDDFFSALLQSNEPVSLYAERYLNTLLVKRKENKRSASRQAVMERDSESEHTNESSSSESEDDEPIRKLAKTTPVTLVEQPPQPSTASISKSMDKLLCKPLDWVQWCSSLSLK